MRRTVTPVSRQRTDGPCLNNRPVRPGYCGGEFLWSEAVYNLAGKPENRHEGGLMNISSPTELLIGGRWTAASGGTFTTYNPATNTPLAEVARAGRGDADRAVAAARRAFDEGTWPKTSPYDRGRVLQDRKSTRLNSSHANIS